jgi:hypothetical protein
MYKVVRHTVDLDIPGEDGETTTASIWCLQAPDGQLFTIVGITPQKNPLEVPEILEDLRVALDFGRTMRQGPYGDLND